MSETSTFLARPRMLVYSVYMAPRQAYVLEDDGVVLEIRNPADCVTLDGVGQWIRDGETMRRLGHE